MPPAWSPNRPFSPSLWLALHCTRSTASFVVVMLRSSDGFNTAHLDGALRYLGPNVAAASALDLAWLTTRYGRFMAIIHAANICKSEGVSIDDFASLFPNEPTIQSYAKVIHEESFHECTATLQVWGAALQRIQQQGVDANINTEIPDFVASFFKKAVNAGYGEQNVMSLFKVL